MSRPDKAAIMLTHRGHIEWWEDRIKSGTLNASELENAKDLIRIHRLWISKLENSEDDHP